MQENNAAKGKTCETAECKLNKAIIQNHLYGTYAVPPVMEELRKYLALPT